MINAGSVIVVFNNRTDTMRLYNYFRRSNTKGVIIPTPNQLSISCGLSLKVNYNDINKVMFAINYLKLSSKYVIYKENKSFNRATYVKIS